VSKLENQLVLFDFVTDLLGGDYRGLVGALKSADLGTRSDGQSYFFSVLESRGAQVRIDRSALAEYDLNILGYEASLGKGRPGFRFTYFQYLAALYAEIFLSRLSVDPAGLLKGVRSYQKEQGYDLPRFEVSDLRKLAFWMATGAGKTLIAHVNLLQWQRYQPFHADNVILVTPNESLSQQHMEELVLSGIAAARADKAGAWADVQVIEITKLYVEGIASEKRRGGVSMPVSMFEGRNLVLVDEGHKGSTSAADLKEERRWRSVREALAGEKGFTVEYSATFAQITENNEELLRDYSKAILVDYGYRRFWEDGYGKDYRVVNLKDEGAYDADELLLAGLLNLYEQRRFYDDKPEELQPYNIEAPLMVFVGAKVTAGGDSEVLEVLQFLDRVLVDPGWAIHGIGALLKGTSGLPSDLFTHNYPYLSELGLDGASVYADLTSRLFHGSGALTLHHIRRAEGEIGLRTADADLDRYCGVVNVGNSSAFFKLATEAGLAEGEDDHITASVFDAIDAADSSVNLLIGSKKFIEGWSSWRVSVMGLLKVGRNAGPQVIQLFGRGVRLKGLGMQLRRSSAVPGDHPSHLPLVETLHIFGVRADYMQSFNEAVRREGIPPPVARLLPIRIADHVEDHGLKYPDPGEYQFGEDIVRFDPGALGTRKIEIDVVPRFTTAIGVETVSSSEGSEPVETASLPSSLVDDEHAFLHALDYKRRRRWANVYITRKAIHELLSGHVRVRAPASLFAGATRRDQAVLQSAAVDAVEKGLERFTYVEQRTREMGHLTTQVVTEVHSNIPRPRAKDGDGAPSYVLAVPEPLLEAVEEIISGLSDGSISAHDDMSEPLPRLFMDEHLYGPLLAAEAEFAGAGPRDIFALHEGVRSTPTGLVKSEVTFIRDLRDAWQRLSEDDEWSDYELFLLRNLPKRGVGFFSTAGFYPDFMLWMKVDGAQALAFVEPHGMVIWDPVKVELLEDIRRMELDVPLLAYIVTATEPRSVGAIGAASDEHHKEEWFKERHILFQDGTGYVDTILAELRLTLELAAAGRRAAEMAPPTSPEPATVLTVVPDSAEIEPRKFDTMLPVYSLSAAAGRFGAGEAVEAEGWVEVPGRVLTNDMFVARAIGDSMEPRISDGDLCIFRAYRGGTRRDRIMLFQWQGVGDPDTGGSYAVKKFFREQELIENDELVGVRVTLSSLNPDFDPLVIEAGYADEIVAIAEYVDSLGPAGVGREISQ
jgi:phage repressor protein C with HTH and peptisase S24 domain